MNFTIPLNYDISTPPLVLYGRASRSKFVFCPSGLGFDTFRLWETLVVGSVPIVESNAAGLDRIYASLPVLVVRNYAEVNEDLLHKAYECFYKNANIFKYNHLSLSYWRQVLLEIARNGSTDIYNDEHPTANKFCNFLSL